MDARVSRERKNEPSEPAKLLDDYVSQLPLDFEPGTHRASDGKTILISLDEGRLLENQAWARKYALIPLSETEFGLEDSDTRCRFGAVGTKVTSLHRREADNPEGPVLTRMEPLQVKDPQVDGTDAADPSN